MRAIDTHNVATRYAPTTQTDPQAATIDAIFSKTCDALPQGYRCRRLIPDDLAALQALRRRALSALPDPDHYVPETDEVGFLSRHCGNGGITAGIYEARGHADHLIAYGMLAFPQGAQAPVDYRSSDMFQASMLWGDAGYRTNHAELASCMVDPHHRGRHLQGILIRLRLNLATHLIPHRADDHLWAMVSTRNPASQKQLEAAGFRRAWTGAINAHRRDIMVRPYFDIIQ